MQENEELLSAEGFLIVDLLKDKDILELQKIADAYLPLDASDFISSSHLLPLQDSLKINELIRSIVLPVFKEKFPSLELLGGTIASKRKGNQILEAHQDWNIVDESVFQSYNLWIPLVDTSSENGTLALIPKSHKWTSGIRGYNITSPYAKYTDFLLKYAIEPSLKKGQAILYNHRMIHLSRPNKMSGNRDTIIFGVREKGADIMVSIKKADGLIYTYYMSIADYYRFNDKKIELNNKLYKKEKALSMLIDKEVLSGLLK